MSYSLSLFAGAGWQFFDNNGTILSGGKLYTYSAGSTSPLTTYTSSSGGTLNPNPIILDSAGRVPAEVWVNSSSIAKFVLKDSTDVLIGTWDNIPSLVSSLNLTGTNNGVVYFNSVGTFTSGTNLTFDGTNLGVAGSATIGSNLNVAGPSALTGNVTASGLLNVTGTTTLSGNASVGGTLAVTGATTLTGNTIINGTFTTTNATTLLAGAILTGTPSVSDYSTKIATTEYTRNMALGWQQTWQAPGYSAGNTYYNTTGKPIAVAVAMFYGSAAADCNMTIDGLQVAKSSSSNASNLRVTLFGIVPPASAYRVDATSCSTDWWVELR